MTAGDQVISARSSGTDHVARPLAAARINRQLFMCGGCYFIYEQAAGIPDQSIPPGTPFAAIPLDWRCPDCGTDKTTFRPHVETPRQTTAG